jgi:mannose-6-phosphate isomerase-like protein (cupin superfamily)
MSSIVLECVVCGLKIYPKETHPQDYSYANIYCEPCSERKNLHPKPAGAYTEPELPFGSSIFNPKQLAIQNTHFRKVLITGYRSQLVLMSLEPRGVISRESHPKSDQWFTVAAGTMKVRIDRNQPPARPIEYILVEDQTFLIPAGFFHEIVNASGTEHLKTYTTYAQANHYLGRVDHTVPTEDYE